MSDVLSPGPDPFYGGFYRLSRYPEPFRPVPKFVIVPHVDELRTGRKKVLVWLRRDNIRFHNSQLLSSRAPRGQRRGLPVAGGRSSNGVPQNPFLTICSHSRLV